MSNLRILVATFGTLVVLLGASTITAGCQADGRLRLLAAGAQVLGAAYLMPVSVTLTQLPPATGDSSVTFTTTAPISATETVTITATTAVTATSETGDTVATQASGDADTAYPLNRPISLTIPAVGLAVPVVPMGWELTVVGDRVTTRWVVPLDAVGWAVNSAGTGDAGNVVLVGQQALGQGLLRAVALGDVVVGNKILVTAGDGKTYTYTVSEVTPPIPAIGATDEETAQAAAYFAPGESAKLTLVTGWPADTTTHRVFVVADYDGDQP